MIMIMCPLRCAGLHNLLPVTWSLYFNKLTKLNIQILNKVFYNVIQYFTRLIASCIYEVLSIPFSQNVPVRFPVQLHCTPDRVLLHVLLFIQGDASQSSCTEKEHLNMYRFQVFCRKTLHELMPKTNQIIGYWLLEHVLVFNQYQFISVTNGLL